MSIPRKLAFALGAVPGVGPVAFEWALRRKLNPNAVTPAKVRNFLLAHRESQAKAVEVESLPYLLNLDVTNACNLACPFCPTGTKQLKRRKAVMDFNSARRIIDKVKSHTLAIRLYNWGEPFLNKDIFRIIRYAADEGLHTMVSSNLSVKIENLAEKVVESGLDNLRVSIDGITQQSLEQYRRKANCELVFENIRRIVEARRRKGSRRPNLELVFLVFRHNEAEIPRLPALKEELGVDSFTPTPAFVYHESFVPRHPDYQPVQTIFTDTCHYLYSELMVEADGHISPCCTNMNERFDVGTVDDLDDLPAFWNNPVYQAMRAFNAGKPYDAPAETLCTHCSFIGCRKPEPGKLSPLPPSLVADGEQYDHGLDPAPLAL
jgi:radical SAM protein with 4Fe4S-binding SPASM domain